MADKPAKVSSTPLGVKAVCGLGILAGAAGAAVGIIYLIEVILFFYTNLVVDGIISLVLGLFFIYGVKFLWKMQKKGWHIVMTIILINIVSIFQTYSVYNMTYEVFISLVLLPIILPLIIGIYLWIKRDLFK